MKFPSNTSDFWFLGTGRFLHQSSSISAADECSVHLWNWQLWRSEKTRLGSRCTYQLCPVLRDLGRVTSIYLCLDFSPAKWVCVSLCPFVHRHIPALPLFCYIFWGGVHPTGGRFPRGVLSRLGAGFGYWGLWQEIEGRRGRWGDYLPIPQVLFPEKLGLLCDSECPMLLPSLPFLPLSFIIFLL